MANDLHTELLPRALPFLRQRVQRRLGASLRTRGSVDDYVHDVIADLLAWRQACHTRSDGVLALLARVVDTTLRDHVVFWSRQRRSSAREQAVDPERVPDERAAPDGCSRAIHAERVRRVHGGLLALDAHDVDVIRLRDFEGLPFARVATLLGCSERAARMRHGRALARLAAAMPTADAG
jgi:RNA polymerase sigma factor (sigma-70 family)